MVFVRRRRSSSYDFGWANEVPRKASEVRRNYGLRNFLGSVLECRCVPSLDEAYDQLFYLKSWLKDQAAQVL